MKLIDVEITFDHNKLIFYFTSDGRVDFRELVKELASIFRTRIELRQIGVRDEAKMLNGIGICGRPLCCATFLGDFHPVSIKMAKEQNLSLIHISIPILLFKQIAFGIASGIVVAKLAVWFLGKNFFDSQQSRTVFLFGVILVSYALPSMFNGNGYLSVYLCGILLGNSGLSQKKFLVHFFDVITDIAQVIIFFLLGLLVTPVNLPSVLLPALMVMVFLTLIARPIVSDVYKRQPTESM